MLLDRLFGERKSASGVWSSTLGRLVSDYLRDGGSSFVGEDGAYRLGAVHSLVELNARVLASLPLQMFQWSADGRSREKVPGTNSLARLLRYPNAWQTGIEFREQLQASALIRGNGYAWINWTQTVAQDANGRLALVDRAQELIPIHPDRIEVEQKDWKQPPTYALLLDRGDKMPLPNEEVFHLRGISTGGAVGRGVIEDMREILIGAREAQRFSNDFWANDATPGLALLYDQPLSKERAKEERDRWDSAHARKGRRTAVLSGGVKMERLSLSAEDSQFLETKRASKEDICGWFFTPPHLIGAVDKSTSWGTGIERQFLSWVAVRLGPDAVKWEQAISQKLINRDDRYYVKHQFGGLLRGDSAARSALVHEALTDGWMTRNEARELDDRNPLDGLDEPLKPANTIPGGTSPAPTPEPKP